MLYDLLNDVLPANDPLDIVVRYLSRALHAPSATGRVRHELGVDVSRPAQLADVVVMLALAVRGDSRERGVCFLARDACLLRWAGHCRSGQCAIIFGCFRLDSLNGSVCIVRCSSCTLCGCGNGRS